jgi:hypothetical protein
MPSGNWAESETDWNWHPAACHYLTGDTGDAIMQVALLVETDNEGLLMGKGRE